MDKIIVALIGIVGVVVVAAGFGLLLAFPIKWCWNATVVPIWSLPVITWGQAWCLNFLAGVLIKSSLSTSN